MKKLNINGYGDDLQINNIRIGDLSPKDHQKIEEKLGGKNYSPLENVVVSHVQDSSTLICRKPDKNEIEKYIEEELIDGLCCYSAVNQGQLNKTIVDAVTHHLIKEKLPTVPRSIRHKYMSAFLLAISNFTEMDRVIPKVAGVEAPDLMFKIARRWGYKVKNIEKGGKHPYTKKLIGSIPSASGVRQKGLLTKPDKLTFPKDPILEVKDLEKIFQSSKN